MGVVKGLGRRGQVAQEVELSGLGGVAKAFWGVAKRSGGSFERSPDLFATVEA